MIIILDGFFISPLWLRVEGSIESCLRHSYENYASNTPKGRQKRIKNLFSKTRILFFLIKLPNQKKEKKLQQRTKHNKKEKEYYYHIHIFTWTVIFMYIVYGKKQSIQQFVPLISSSSLFPICENRSKVCDKNFFIPSFFFFSAF